MIGVVRTSAAAVNASTPQRQPKATSGREIACTSLLFTNLKWTREHTTTHSTQEGRAASMQRSLRGLTRIVNGRGTRTFRSSWSAKLDMCARRRVDWVCLMTLAQVPGHAPKKLRLTIDSLPLLVTSVSYRPEGYVQSRAIEARAASSLPSVVAHHMCRQLVALRSR